MVHPRNFSVDLEGLTIIILIYLFPGPTDFVYCLGWGRRETGLSPRFWGGDMVIFSAMTKHSNFPDRGRGKTSPPLHWTEEYHHPKPISFRTDCGIDYFRVSYHQQPNDSFYQTEPILKIYHSPQAPPNRFNKYCCSLPEGRYSSNPQVELTPITVLCQGHIPHFPSLPRGYNCPSPLLLGAIENLTLPVPLTLLKLDQTFGVLTSI